MAKIIKYYIYFGNNEKPFPTGFQNARKTADFLPWKHIYIMKYVWSGRWILVACPNLTEESTIKRIQCNPMWFGMNRLLLNCWRHKWPENALQTDSVFHFRRLKYFIILLIYQIRNRFFIDVYSNRKKIVAQFQWVNNLKFFFHMIQTSTAVI